MTKFWEFPEEHQLTLVEISLDKYGSLIGDMSSPHSRIFTFDQGSQCHPRYIVAKGLQVPASAPMGETHKLLARSLHEVNRAYAVCHHPSIQQFFDIQIVHGLPFLLSRKRDATLRDVIANAKLSEPEALRKR